MSTTDEGALLRGVITEVRRSKPLPWRLEEDWGISVESAQGRIFFGSRDECIRIIELAHEDEKRGEDGERLIEAEFKRLKPWRSESPL